MMSTAGGHHLDGGGHHGDEINGTKMFATNGNLGEFLLGTCPDRPRQRLTSPSPQLHHRAHGHVGLAAPPKSMARWAFVLPIRRKSLCEMFACRWKTWSEKKDRGSTN